MVPVTISRRGWDVGEALRNLASALDMESGCVIRVDVDINHNLDTDRQSFPTYFMVTASAVIGTKADIIVDTMERKNHVLSSDGRIATVASAVHSILALYSNAHWQHMMHQDIMGNPAALFRLREGEEALGGEKTRAFVMITFVMDTRDTKDSWHDDNALVHVSWATSPVWGEKKEIDAIIRMLGDFYGADRVTTSSQVAGSCVWPGWEND